MTDRGTTKSGKWNLHYPLWRYRCIANLCNSRDALKRALDYRSPLNFIWKSHNESRAKASNHHHGENQANKRAPHHNKTAARLPQEEQRS